MNETGHEPMEEEVRAGSGPLEGIRIIDLSSVVMGPLATQIFGDLGADVITVEDPGGTLARVMTAGPVPGLSGLALNLLRNKRNVVLDLKSGDDRGHLLDLVATADAFVTNLRPGTLARLGLTYDVLREVRPDLVYCQAQGYPSDSDRADAPAYDDVIQAESGLPDAFRLAGARPQLAPSLIADKVCGLTIAYGVMAALLQRERTGVGQRIEVPMVDVMTAFTLCEHGGAAIPQPPLGSAGYGRILSPSRGPQQTADGWINILPYTRENFEVIFRAGGRDDLAADERIASARSRITHAEDLYREVAELTGRYTTDEWLRICADAGVPVAPVPSLAELVEALPEDEHPLAGRYKVIPQPVRFSEATGPVVRRPAATSGQHTDEVLAELAARREGGS